MTTDEPTERPSGERSAHEAAWLALPWHVNGTLDPREAAMVEAELERSPALRAERRLLELLRDDVRETPVFDGAMERGFARLAAEIDDEVTEPDSRRRTWPRLGRRWGQALLETPLRIRALLGAQAAVIAAVLLVLVVAPTSLREPGTFTMLASEPVVADGPYWRLRIVDDAREADLRQLLLDNALVIVDGPSTTGLYTLQPSGAVPEDPVVVTAHLAASPIVAFALHLP